MLSLSQGAYSAKQVLINESKVAAQAHIAMYDLMELAGKSAFEYIQKFYLKQEPNPKQKSNETSMLEDKDKDKDKDKDENDKPAFLILCGKGNNGGDGFIVARLAQLAGYPVEVLITCEKSQLQGDALSAYQSMITAGVTQLSFVNLSTMARYVGNFSGDIIVDALFGIGFKGELSSQWQQVIEAINKHKAFVASIDVPSGLCASTGNVSSVAVIAQLTVTFIVYKQGLLTGIAANYVGQLVLAGLGLNTLFNQEIATDTFLQSTNTLPALTKRKAASHKGDIGLALAIGGGLGLPGAIRLSSEAALRCGTALLAVCCHENNQALVFNGRPELMLAPTDSTLLTDSSLFDKAGVCFIGPGLGRDIWAENMFSAISQLMCSDSVDDATVKKGYVLDADALYWLSKTTLYNNHWVLTPHPKEAATLLHCDVATIEADRFAAVNAIANKYGGICLLKGAGTLISDGKRIVINTTGNAGMASGGMGDVLTGIVAALMLQMSDNFAATQLAAYIHGAAADIIVQRNGQRGLLASDLFIELQHLVNQF